MLDKYNIVLPSGKLNNNLKKLIRNYPELKDWIWSNTQFILNDDINTSTERMFCILNNITELQMCRYCDKPVKFYHQKSKTGYLDFCSSKCANRYNLTKRKITNNNKYGGNSATCCPDVIEKSKQTNLSRYGSEWHQTSMTGKQQHQRTNIARYGTISPLGNSEIREKCRQVINDRYGVDYAVQNSDVFNQLKQTNLQRYGVEFPLQHPDILDKLQNTNITKYGVKHSWSNYDIRKKYHDTMLKEYGVEFPTQQHMVDVISLLENFDWLYDEYIIQNKSSSQISAELGCVHYVTVNEYLHRHEIEIKQTYWCSYKQITWLNNIMEQQNIFIQHAMNGDEYRIPGTRYRADGYCAETNTIYEFHGDYWHGNPVIYQSNYINNSTGCSMGELYNQTIKKEQLIRELGYNLVVIWESDFDISSTVA